MKWAMAHQSREPRDFNRGWFSLKSVNPSHCNFLHKRIIVACDTKHFWLIFQWQIYYNARVILNKFANLFFNRCKFCAVPIQLHKNSLLFVNSNINFDGWQWNEKICKLACRFFYLWWKVCRNPTVCVILLKCYIIRDKFAVIKEFLWKRAM